MEQFNPKPVAEDIETKVGNLSGLSTTEKTSLVGAVNEVNEHISDIDTPIVLTTKAEVDNWCNSIVSKASKFGIAILSNSTKDDAFTNYMDKTAGVLMLFESDAVWNKHPYFIVISEGSSFTGVANVQSTGVTLSTSRTFSFS